MAEMRPLPASSRTAQTPAARSARRGSILLVEDRDDVRQGLAQLLDFNGYLVEEARDGASALSYLERDGASVALLILDLVLPGRLSGRDLRGRMLADPVCAEIPTVIVTAAEIEPSGRAGLHPAAWLEKPFRFDQLHDVIKRFVVPETPACLSSSDIVASDVVSSDPDPSSTKQFFHP